MENVAELRVTVFSDYICPFCYVGHHRLMRLRDNYDLRINWCFIEIHPETSAEGEPVASLDYPSEQWNQLMQNLEIVAREEGIPIAEHTFTTNSRDALPVKSFIGKTDLKTACKPISLRFSTGTSICRKRL